MGTWAVGQEAGTGALLIQQGSTRVSVSPSGELSVPPQADIKMGTFNLEINSNNVYVGVWHTVRPIFSQGAVPHLQQSSSQNASSVVRQCLPAVLCLPACRALCPPACPLPCVPARLLPKTTCACHSWLPSHPCLPNAELS